MKFNFTEQKTLTLNTLEELKKRIESRESFCFTCFIDCTDIDILGNYKNWVDFYFYKGECIGRKASISGVIEGYTWYIGKPISDKLKNLSIENTNNYYRIPFIAKAIVDNFQRQVISKFEFKDFTFIPGKDFEIIEQAQCLFN